MGYTPQQVNDMSMWQYLAAVEGYVRANDPDASKELSAQEADDLWQWLQTKH